MPFDSMQRFLFEPQHIRGELLHLRQTLKTILSQHDYPDMVKPVLTQTLLAAALLTDTIKFKGQLTIQFQSDGFIQLLVAKCNHKKELRAMARWNEKMTPLHADKALGKGQLVITIEYDDKVQPYQSIVPIENQTVFQALEYYFQQSEQLPTKFYCAFNTEQAAALMLQQMPGKIDQATWQELTILTDTLTEKELFTCDNQTILKRLFHEYNLRLFNAKKVQFKCQCSIPRMERAILTLGEKEANAVLKDNRFIEVKCDFCGNNFEFDKNHVSEIFSNKASINEN